MLFFVGQSHYNISQVTQALVDVLRFSQSFPSGTRLTQAFRARQVNEVKSSCKKTLAKVVSLQAWSNGDASSKLAST